MAEANDAAEILALAGQAIAEAQTLVLENPQRRRAHNGAQQ